MRLTQIKLAGFKSFVDSTSINVPGQLVGVVGPNGCGKSNIIDAVRWVLGESRASALRGDSMQDVIFNGSAQRNPVARASVELHFDNSLGKAAGAWSQYAEIAVKRVLQRDGESGYFINNTQVRRRDVHDIFLGTGLGPRAYAIVEQGMISRIIEAKPEELRVFLEEAAGISKYKERRRETENRLADTRENLARVLDIRQELDTQISKLERQADIAAKYKQLVAERDLKQNLLFLLRRNEAGVEGQRYAQEIASLELQVESETTALRELERELEQVRVDLLDSTDAVGSAQTSLYQVNSEISALELEIRHLTDTRQRIQSQIDQEQATLVSGRRQMTELEEARGMWVSRLEAAEQRVAAAEANRQVEEQRLPVAERAYATAQEALSAVRGLLSETENALELETTHAAHAEKNLSALDSRRQRLADESAALTVPDEGFIARLSEDLQRSQDEISRQELLLGQMESTQASLELARDRAMEGRQGLERDLAALDAKLVTLQRIQSRVDEDAAVEAWIEQNNLKTRPRLWQKISVEPGWEIAVESVLREHLHSLEVLDSEELQNLATSPPSARFEIHIPPDTSGEGKIFPPGSLRSLVSTHDARLGELLDAWLGDVRLVEGIPTMGDRLALSNREILVNRLGHQYSRYGIVFHSPDAIDSGILARQREIESLITEAAGLRDLISTADYELAEAMKDLDEHLLALATLRAAGEVLRQRHHDLRLQEVKRQEENDRYLSRSRQISQELEDINAMSSSEAQSKDKALEVIGELRAKHDELGHSLTDMAGDYQRTGEDLSTQRDALKRAELEEQTAGFARKECQGKIDEIESSIQQSTQRIASSEAQAAQLGAELSGLNTEPLEQSLQTSLSVRIEREKVLTEARVRQDELSERMRGGEESRQERERRISPLRERIAELKLKEQAARLSAEQYAAQLAASAANEQELTELLKAGQRPSQLQTEITRLGNAIEELGAINMAALDELTASKERKFFLDSQSEDLTEALDILESAIRRIDRETRELLQVTFNTVNAHFGELFPALFGGGEAKLEMSGEEILDAGVQVIARPPGKKNSSIHLLSGGEKALTAISLVFAIFQLNPAPFCLLDEVDAPLDDSNTERFCDLVKKMSGQTQFLFISHNKITMEMSNQLIGVTMQEQGVSRVVAVDMEEALRMREPMAA